MYETYKKIAKIFIIKQLSINSEILSYLNLKRNPLKILYNED